jgi:L-fuconolactonase
MMLRAGARPRPDRGAVITTADEEPILDPEIPIVDSHHHLSLVALPDDDPPLSAGAIPHIYTPIARAHARYLFDDFVADVSSGHNVRATVFVDSHAMYRRYGPTQMRPVGEVEFANGAAAMAASGLFGETLICAGIVGGVDLDLGPAIEEVLHAQIAAGNGRFRGVRVSAFSSDDTLLPDGLPSDWLRRSDVRGGVALLAPLGLTLDVTVLETEIGEVAELARAFPETTIILDHLGIPLGVGRYQGRRQERFAGWAAGMRRLAGCPNVIVKLGGLGMPFAGFDWIGPTAAPPSEQLAADWEPYVESCIDAFGTVRCMFESNYPADAGAGRYRTIWNAFKRIAAGASDSERSDLFSETAKRVYRLEY